MFVCAGNSSVEILRGILRDDTESRHLLRAEGHFGASQFEGNAEKFQDDMVHETGLSTYMMCGMTGECWQMSSIAQWFSFRNRKF